MPTNALNRRDFLTATAAVGTLAAMPAWAADKAQKRLRLGLDNFAVRAMGWKAKEL
ncbi:uncharacterized protein METZ01_LOCUS260757, partial [marine metagenome]